MKKTLTTAAVVLAVLGSAGTASAEVLPTHPGNAYGNCGDNRQFGLGEAGRKTVGNGFGGHRKDDLCTVFVGEVDGGWQ